jgi:LysM repeat protein
MEKNSFWRKLLAFLLSIVVVAIVFPTIFAVPLEFLIMNESTYSSLVTNEKLLNAGQDAFSDYIAHQLSVAGDGEVVPPVFENTEVLSEGIKTFVTNEWLSQTLNDVSVQLLQFLNFKQPFGIVQIDLSAIKADVLAERDSFVENILNSSAPCNTEEIAQLTSGSLSVQDVPLCNPPTELKSRMVAFISDYVEEFLYKIPQEYQINVEDAIMINQTNSLFSYSMVRWIFRILPVLFLVLLILIAVCLRKNRAEMRTWIGRLLVTAAALSLVLLLVLLIGSEQFTALFINQTLSAENSAFGTLLLIILQSVTYKTLLWMAVVAAGLFCIGFLILFFNKPKTKRETADIVEEEISYQEADEEMLEAKQAMAEAVSVEPTTDEEVPEEEEKKKRSKKASRKTSQEEE